MDFVSALTGLFGLAQAGISAAEQYATVAPSLEKGVATIAGSGKAVVSDLGLLIGDLKAGKYGNTEADVARALTDFGKVTASLSAAVPAVASLVSKAPTLPSVAGVATLLKAL